MEEGLQAADPFLALYIYLTSILANDACKCDLSGIKSHAAPRGQTWLPSYALHGNTCLGEGAWVMLTKPVDAGCCLSF